MKKERKRTNSGRGGKAKGKGRERSVTPQEQPPVELQQAANTGAVQNPQEAGNFAEAGNMNNVQTPMLINLPVNGMVQNGMMQNGMMMGQAANPLGGMQLV